MRKTYKLHRILPDIFAEMLESNEHGECNNLELKVKKRKEMISRRKDKKIILSRHKAVFEGEYSGN